MSVFILPLTVQGALLLNSCKSCIVHIGNLACRPLRQIVWRLHILVKATERFGLVAEQDLLFVHIQDVDPDRACRFGLTPSYFEVEPVAIAFGVRI